MKTPTPDYRLRTRPVKESTRRAFMLAYAQWGYRPMKRLTDGMQLSHAGITTQIHFRWNELIITTLDHAGRLITSSPQPYPDPLQPRGYI